MNVIYSFGGRHIHTHTHTHTHAYRLRGQKQFQETRRTRFGRHVPGLKGKGSFEGLEQLIRRYLIAVFSEVVDPETMEQHLKAM